MIHNPDDRIQVFVEYIKDCKVDSSNQFWCRGDDRLPQVGDLVGLSCGEEGHKEVYKVTEVLWTDNWRTMHVKAAYDLRKVVLDTHVPGSGEATKKKSDYNSRVTLHLRYIVNGRHVSTQSHDVPRIEIPNRGDRYKIDDVGFLGYSQFEVVSVRWTNTSHTECMAELVNVTGK